jgi:hypothetical protein
MIDEGKTMGRIKHISNSRQFKNQQSSLDNHQSIPRVPRVPAVA